MPMGTFIWPWWANDHEIDMEYVRPIVDGSRCQQHSRSPYFAHVAPMGTWPWCCTSTGQNVSIRFQGLASLRPWARPYGPNGQITMTLHICRQIRFKWTWFGVNRPSGWWVRASARLDGRTNGRTYERIESIPYSPLFFLRKDEGQKDYHIDLNQISFDVVGQCGWNWSKFFVNLYELSRYFLCYSPVVQTTRRKCRIVTRDRIKLYESIDR